MNYIPRALTKEYRKRLQRRLENWTGSYTPISINDALTLLRHVEMLEKEADWLAERLQTICSHEVPDVCAMLNIEKCPFFPNGIKCKSESVDWREAARKAVGEQCEGD